jgi:hypothetical protein
LGLLLRFPDYSKVFSKAATEKWGEASRGLVWRQLFLEERR